MTVQENARVLVVEDQSLAGAMMQGLLEKYGYTVVGRAMDGQQAVEMTQALRPDVVLMDIGLPDVDGIEATRLIQEHCPTPVVMLTAHDTPEMVEQASAAGAGAYLVKPTDPQEIERAITITIGRFGDMMELRSLNAELQAEIAERKRAEEAIRRHSAELETLRLTSLQLTSSLDLSAVLDSICDSALSLVGATDCHIYLSDQASETFTFGVALWEDGRREAAVEMPRRDGLSATVAREGRSIVINDAPQHPLYTTPGAPEWGLQAIAGFPLKRAERVVGVFTVAFLKPHTFSEEELRVLGLLAAQAAIAIENARLFEEEERRATQLALINEVGDEAASILDLDRLMQEVARSVQESFNYYNVLLAVLDEKRREVLKPAVAGGLEPIASGENRQSMDEGIIGLVVRTGKSWLAGDISKDPHFVPGFRGEVSTKSELCVPIKLGDKVIGALDVQSTRLNDFNQADVVAMEVVADRVAIGIENARLYEETQRRAEEMTALHKIGLTTTSTLDLNEVLKLIYEQVNQLMKPDAFYVALYDERKEEIRFEIFVEKGEPLGKFSRKLEEGGLTGWIVRSEQPLMIKNLAEESPPVEPVVVGEFQPETSYLGVPLRARDKVIGVISVQSSRPHVFNEEDQRFLSALANQAAIAIENARLFEEIEERRVYLEGVLGSAPDAIVTLDDHHRIVEWNSGAERLFGYSREGAVGQSLDDLITNPDVFEEAVGLTQVLLGGMEVPPTEVIRYRKDGSPVDVILAGSPILVGDKLIGIVAVYTDITARKRMEETLRTLALIDELTGLYNRRGLSTLGQQQLRVAHRVQRSMLLLFADFDGLKQINDAFGHTEGDRALIEVGNILRHTFRDSDVIARIGGDEFVVLAIQTDSISPEILATRLQENLEARNAREGLRCKLSLSVGIARYHPEHPCSIDELLVQADRAMYERKLDA